MDTPGMTRSGQDVKVLGSLYVAFELGDRSWKLCLGDGVRSPSGELKSEVVYGGIEAGD
ncbi:hypothetical protein OKW30_007874 [Paraburkholderia sp. Clong3]